MMSCTRAESRRDSTPSRAAKRRTASSSSAASPMASESREMAPTGVLSSCETLTTKSWRMASVRVTSVRSSARIRMYSSSSGATRSSTTRLDCPRGPRGSSMRRSTMTPSARTVRVSSRSWSWTSECPRTRPRA
ncbi:hypothetical protein GY12_13520 [Micrococcus luteus]|nr:hypothetical protein GY12_13520 [Micrococcus luteus]